MSEPIDPHGGQPSEPVRPLGDPATPEEKLSVSDLYRLHPELAPEPKAPRVREQPRWRTFVAFGLLFLIVLGLAAGAADVAVCLALVGSGLGGREVVLTNVTSILRNDAARVVSPPSLAGHSVSVIGGTRDGVYYLWPGQSGFASDRGWSFLLIEWLPLFLLFLFVLALRIIVKAFVATARGQEV